MRRSRRAGVAGLVLVAVAGPALTALGEDAPSAEAPLPPPRPPELALPAPPPAPSAPSGEAPLPPERPTDLVVAPPGPTPLTPDDLACRERLTGLGVAWEAATVPSDEVCGAPHPLRVSRLPGDLAMHPAAIIVCPMAEALARWTPTLRDAAVTHLGQSPTTVLIAGSYVCRGQNHEEGAKLSEHAFANAVDVAGFGFAARPDVGIAERSKAVPEAAFQTAIHASACALFTTVLGPGADPSHGDHLHLDLRARRGGFRLCQ